MCITHRSQLNHGGKRTIDLVSVAASVILTVLLAATTYTAYEYYKQLKKAQNEYKKARDTVEDVVMSFNRELKREAEKIAAISYRAESAASQAEAGLRQAGSIEERVTPLESKVEKIGADLTAVTGIVGSLTDSNAKMLEEIAAVNLAAVDDKIQNVEIASQNKFASVETKVQDLETLQEALKAKVAGLEERMQKLTVLPGPNAEVASPPLVPVLPIKRDKALASLTDTEVAVLEFLSAEGPKTAPEIKEKVQLSREHTSRLMKKLYEEGYLERETGRLPFRYSVKKELENLLKKPEPQAN